MKIVINKSLNLHIIDYYNALNNSKIHNDKYFSKIYNRNGILIAEFPKNSIIDYELFYKYLDSLKEHYNRVLHGHGKYTEHEKKSADDIHKKYRLLKIFKFLNK